MTVCVCALSAPKNAGPQSPIRFHDNESEIEVEGTLVQPKHLQWRGWPIGWRCLFPSIRCQLDLWTWLLQMLTSQHNVLNPQCWTPEQFLRFHRPKKSPKNEPTSPFTSAAMAGRTSMVAGVLSSCRPPWLETTWKKHRRIRIFNLEHRHLGIRQSPLHPHRWHNAHPVDAECPVKVWCKQIYWSD